MKSAHPAPYSLQACSTAFKAVDADAQRRWPERGGTTATLALACGWELLVANVGDSCAYLDTGSEVLQVRDSARSCPGKKLRQLNSTGA